jgi:hypothetical protein
LAQLEQKNCNKSGCYSQIVRGNVKGDPPTGVMEVAMGWSLCMASVGLMLQPTNSTEIQTDFLCHHNRIASSVAREKEVLVA